MMPSEELPETINTLLKNLGQSEKLKQLWKTSVSTGVWNQIDFVTESVAVNRRKKPEEIHEFISTVVSVYREWATDLDAPLVWVIIKSNSRIYLHLSTQMYLFDSGKWLLVGDSSTTWSAEEVSATIGVIDEIYLGIDFAEDFVERNGYLHPYLESFPEAMEWFESIDEPEFEEEDFIEVPGLKNTRIWVSANSWWGPFLGPISPDPNSDFHRLRLLAISLAQDGFNVSVDFGPLVQSFDEWHSQSGEHFGEITLSANSPSVISSTGVVPVLMLTECPESESQFVNEKIIQFGLELYSL